MLSSSAYLPSPPWARMSERVLLVAGYLLTAAVLFVNGWDMSGWWLDQTVAAVATVACLVAVAGVVRNRYRIEWPSIPFVLMGVLILVVTPTPFSPEAGFDLALVAIAVMHARRYLRLAVVAYRLRRQPVGVGGGE